MEFDPSQFPRRRELRTMQESGQELTAEEKREYRDLIAAHVNYLLEQMKNG